MAAPQQPDRPRASSTIWRSYRYLWPYRRATAVAYLLLLAITVLSLIGPQLIGRIVDDGIRRGDTAIIGRLTAALLGLALLKALLTYRQQRDTEIASQGVAYDLRNAIYAKLAALSFSYHDRTETGQLLSRAVQDVERIRFLTGRATLGLVNGIVLLLGTLLVLVWVNPLLAFLALGTMPLMAYQAYRFGRVFRPLSIDIQQQLAVLTTRLEQNLRGARVVKAFAQEEAEIARFGAENRRWFDLSAASARLQAINVPALDLIANLGTVFIIWYGGSLVIAQRLTLGELVAFTTYLSQLYQPVRRLGLILPAVAIADAAGERIFEILDTPSEVAESPDARPLPPVQGHVRFERVSFGYTRRHRVLNDVTFEALPGQMIALLGATGSGKTTITNLLPRFYDPTEGRITIDGVDIREATLASLRDQIGIVLQESTLFADTIRANILFGRPSADEAAVIAAARAAQAHDFITAFPDGYDTLVGERGVMLSGGQRQRVAIARALLKDPRILILDDATSSVDTATEGLIQLALETLMHGRTSFVIAQRLSTVRRADCILVLEHGRIAARGAHAELLQTSDLYAAIYHQQLRPQETAAVGAAAEERP